MQFALQGRFLIVLFSAFLLLTAGEKKEKPKPAVVELQGLKVAVDGTHISIEGELRNKGERTIEKLVLLFHFFDTSHQQITILKLEIDDETIDPGEEAEIHAEANEPPRSVSMEVTAADRGEKDLKIVNPGPYPIE